MWCMGSWRQQRTAGGTHRYVLLTAVLLCCIYDIRSRSKQHKAAVERWTMVVWSGDRSQAPTKATSHSTARTCHKRMVLPICCLDYGLSSGQKKTKKNARTYDGKKNCHALQSARIAPRPRPKCPDGLPVSTSLAFCLKVLERRDMFQSRRKNDKP